MIRVSSWRSARECAASTRKSPVWRASTWCSRAASWRISCCTTRIPPRAARAPVEVGRRVRLRRTSMLADCLAEGIHGFSFSFFVISAAPEEVIHSALEASSSRHTSSAPSSTMTRCPAKSFNRRVPAGYGKVAVLDELERGSTCTPIAPSTSATAAPTCT